MLLLMIILPKGTGAFGKLKFHVLQISLLIIDTPIVQVIPGGVCVCVCLLGDSRFMCFPFW